MSATMKNGSKKSMGMKGRIMGLCLAGLCLAAGGLSAEEAAGKTADATSAPSTLFQAGGVRFSGYGAPVAKLGSFAGSLGLLAGGKGGVVINDSLVLGAEGYSYLWAESDPSLDGLGYGGLLLEYHFFPKALFNFSAGLMAGAGGAGGDGEGDSFFALEPSVTASVNVTRFMRLGLGASYRWSYGLDLPNFKDADFAGFSGSLILAFGWF